jgi:hypothetical protein
MHMCGTRIEKKVEICATNLANKTKFMSTNTKKWKKIVKIGSIYHKGHLWSKIWTLETETLWTLVMNLSKGPNWVGVFPFTWGRKQTQFPKRRVFYSLEYRTIEKVQKPSNSE